MEGMRPVVANFGFLLQINGLLLILPIAIGLHNAELQAVASIMATCFISFGVGFVLNSYCERKELDGTTSLWFMLVTFIVLPLVLMIPYVWNNVFGSSLFDLLTDAYFETVSGFTTTGFTFITHPELLPASLLFYRSLVEFIGGIGFVYLLVAFLYPNRSLDSFAEAFGVERLGEDLKRLFVYIMLVYSVFVVLFTVLFYFVYSPDVVVASCAAIDILTGGYAISVTGGIGFFQVSVVVLMLLGSLNFAFHYNLFHRRPHIVLTREIRLYLWVIAGATVLFAILAWVNPWDSLFHVISAISSAGTDYIGVAATPIAAKILIIVIMLIGGCTFSMAGGIRIQRVQLLIDALRGKSDPPDKQQLKEVLTSIVCFIAVLFVLSLIFSTIGISLLDSIFEVGSALTTNGDSMGITTAAMPFVYKWLLIFAMNLGRIEILAAFKALSSTPIFDTAKRLADRLREEAQRRLPRLE